MNDYPINTKELFQLDRKLIEYLKNRPVLASLAKSANDSYYKLTEKGYAFETSWPVVHAGDVYDLNISGVMDINISNELSFLSYVFCVSREGLLLRKFHYDYECGRGKSKPLFHLQYGGEPLPSLEGFGGFEYLVSWLSEPRLFYIPMSLVLVLEQVFLEFPDDLTDKIRKDSYWKGLLKNAQKEVLAPFFTQCLKKIDNNECLYAECYV